MRILFIHGFGEDETIFSKIAPAIAGDKIFLNVWKLLGDAPRPNITVLEFAKEIVNKYNISKNDVIIGHSMGGWIAYHIKHFTHSPIVQIGSWTHIDRVVRPIPNTNLSYFLIRMGILFNPLTKALYTNMGYKNLPSKVVFASIFDQLIRGNKENIINQLRLIFTDVPEEITVTPDLRIHAKRDIVIRYPREPFHEVTGDHFTLRTHPHEVYEPIIAFLKKIEQS